MNRYIIIYNGEDGETMYEVQGTDHENAIARCPFSFTRIIKVLQVNQEWVPQHTWKQVIKI